MKNVAVAILVLMFGVAVQPSLGVIVFEDGFESAVAEPGDAVGTPVIGASWTIFEDDNNDVGISGLVNSGSKAALFQRANADNFVTKALANLTAADTATVQANGMAMIELAFIKSDQNDSSALGIFGFSNGAAANAIQIRFDDDGNVLYYNGSVIDTGLNYVLGSYQDVGIALDFANYTFTVSVEGNTTTGSTDVAFTLNESTMTSFDIVAGKDAVFRVDDLLITTVPEPATMILLGLGAIGGLARRNRE